MIPLPALWAANPNSVGVFKPSSRPAIISLFFWRGPFAIIWAVIAVIIYTIKRIFQRWRLTHVGQELIKIVPSFANLYSATAIVFKTSAFLPATPVAHSFPALINPGVLSVGRGVAVLSKRFNCGNPVEASARFSVPRVDSPSSDYGIFAAVAKEKPSVIFSFLAIRPNGRQLPEFLTRKVKSLSHVTFSASRKVPVSQGLRTLTRLQPLVPALRILL